MRFANLPVGRILFLTTVCVSWAAHQSHAGLMKGDIIKLDRSGDARGGASGGGEFTIWKLINGGTASESWQSLNVQTFCMEFNEHITLGEKLLVGGISDRAVLGGIGGNEVINGVNHGDPLDPRTQFLYRSFITNNLASTGFEDNHDDWSSALQRAIWLLEGEVTGWGPKKLEAKVKTLYDLANSYEGGAFDSVFVLNLFSMKADISGFKVDDPSTWTDAVTGLKNVNYKRQDQLFYQPPPPPSLFSVPEPNSGILWLTGLCTIACCIRARAFDASRLTAGTGCHSSDYVTAQII